MSQRGTRILVVAGLIAVGVIACFRSTSGQKLISRPAIPRAWDDEAMKQVELPLANRTASPKHVTSDYYYRMPVRPIYRSYPIYYPGREPAGYFSSLQEKRPEIIF